MAWCARKCYVPIVMRIWGMCLRMGLPPLDYVIALTPLPWNLSLPMTSFDAIYALACERHQGPENVKKRLPQVASKNTLRSRSDAWYLSLMMRRVFRAGLNHAWVDSRWPYFEKAFFGFDPDKLVLMPDDMFDARLEDENLIRLPGKMQAIRINAQLVRELRAEYGGVG